MHLVFNELSLFKKIVDKKSSGEIFENLIKTYSQAIKKNIGFSREIITPIDLNDIEISNGYYALEWRNSKTVDRDLQRLYKRICDLQKIYQCSDSESELTHNADVGKGLLIAFQDDLFAISLNSNDCWNYYRLECEYYTLDTDETTKIHVYNLSSPQIIDDNIQDIKSKIQMERLSFTTPDELLKNLDGLFPSLMFHQVAIDQIKCQLEKQHIPIVCKKLSQLEQYFSKWDGTSFNQDEFPNRSVSPQSTETLNRFKREHTYVFDDKSIVVSYHMRYTGNIPGRIYFYPDKDLKKARICSLTTKLPTVSNTKAKV